MDSFIARQPIFDKTMKVYAYELLYRSNESDNYFSASDSADHASSRIMMDTFSDIGIEKITGGKLAFVNFTENLLEQNIATLFPKKTLVVEVLETVTPGPEVLEQLRALKADGYRIALDDFEYGPQFKDFVALANIIKIDFLAQSLEEIRSDIAKFPKKGITLLAEKVENNEMYEAAKEMGFELFQGYFFEKPVILTGRSVDPLKISYLQLMRSVWERELDFEEVAKVIKRDVALSYKLLRLVNSVHYARRREIKDIMHAMVMLGEAEVRKWVSLIVMVGCGDNKPDELIRGSMLRAFFMEDLGKRMHLRREQADVLFLTGLFSLIDVMMDTSMEDVMSRLSVPVEVEEALVGEEGMAGEMLHMVRAYEQGRWDESQAIFGKYAVKDATLPELYLEAVAKADQIGK